MCNHELKRLFYTSDDDYGIQTCRVELENEDDKYTLCYCEKCGQVFVMEIAETHTEPDRKAIEDEVWEFTTTCTKMDGSDSVDVFGGFSVDSFTKYSYQEAKAKYEEWKKQKDEIRVGDEVALQDGNFKYVVMGFHFNTAYLLASDGSVSKFPVSKLRKLNRHFNETEELLKKMREGKE